MFRALSSSPLVRSLFWVAATLGLLLASPALAQEESPEPPAEAPAEVVEDDSGDEAIEVPKGQERASWRAGHRAGKQAGAKVSCREFYAYGGCASCILGPVGCGGVALIARNVDPDPGPIPPAPPEVADPVSWEAGYQDGYVSVVQRTRTRKAIVGGLIVTAPWVAAVVFAVASG